MDNVTSTSPSAGSVTLCRADWKMVGICHTNKVVLADELNSVSISFLSSRGIVADSMLA